MTSDGELRARTTELVVHLSCGGVRGPVPPDDRWTGLLGRWQSCDDEDDPETWPGCDVSRVVDLCRVCLRGTAGGPSRWAWTACERCRTADRTFGPERSLPLGRHSLMNRVGQTPGATVAFVHASRRLLRWRDMELRRLATVFAGRVDVPVREWQHVHPPTMQASYDALVRLRSDTATDDTP